MKRESKVILAVLGIIPLQAVAHNQHDRPVNVQEALALNEGTVSAVQALLASGALYASDDGTRLMIDSKVVGPELHSRLENSRQVRKDNETGDYVVDSKFASALSGSRILNQKMASSVSEVLLLMKLERELKDVPRVELAGFRTNPFMN
ncbi:MAG: hypothetical protein AB7G93_13205 [Bdellovibrionales bacterium]